MIAPAINRALRQVPRWAVWLAGLIPLALLVWDAAAGRLGVDPVRMIEHRSGRTALYFLIASLCVTPLLRLVRINAMRFRRALGMLCFIYVVCHLAAWLVLDMGLLWAQITRDITRRPYLLAGAGSLIILIPMAATASDRAIRRLGTIRWRRIHRWVYLAAPLAGLHWLLAQKIPDLKSQILAGVILVLLSFRLFSLSFFR